MSEPLGEHSGLPCLPNNMNVSVTDVVEHIYMIVRIASEFACGTKQFINIYIYV